MDEDSNWCCSVIFVAVLFRMNCGKEAGTFTFSKFEDFLCSSLRRQTKPRGLLQEDWALGSQAGGEGCDPPLQCTIV